MLLLTLTLLPTVPIAAKKPPPTEERYYVTFTGPDITSDRLELMSRGTHGKGGKSLGLLTPQTSLHPGKDCTPTVEYTNLTFFGDVWGFWAGDHVGKISIGIDLKFNEVGMVYFFDYEHDPLDFWRLISRDERRNAIGEWIPGEGKDEGIARFSDARFEIWKYSDQGDTTILYLTFDVTIEPKP
jgi:hypothetical protein